MLAVGVLSNLSVECEREFSGDEWMDVLLLNLEQAYKTPEWLSSAKRPLLCRCREQVCELSATRRSRD